jgi:hypothetical protein
VRQEFRYPVVQLVHSFEEPLVPLLLDADGITDSARVNPRGHLQLSHLQIYAYNRSRSVRCEFALDDDMNFPLFQPVVSNQLE